MIFEDFVIKKDKTIYPIWTYLFLSFKCHICFYILWIRHLRKSYLKKIFYHFSTILHILYLKNGFFWCLKLEFLVKVFLGCIKHIFYLIWAKKLSFFCIFVFFGHFKIFSNSVVFSLKKVNLIIENPTIYMEK